MPRRGLHPLTPIGWDARLRPVPGTASIAEGVADLAALLQASEGVRAIIEAGGLAPGLVEAIEGLGIPGYQSHGTRRRQRGVGLDMDETGDLGLGRWGLVSETGQAPKPTDRQGQGDGPRYGVLGEKQVPGGYSTPYDPEPAPGQQPMGAEPDHQWGGDMTPFQSPPERYSPADPEGWDQLGRPRFFDPGEAEPGELPPGNRRWEDRDQDGVPNWGDYFPDGDVDPSGSGGGGLGAALLRLLGRADLLTWGSPRRKPVQVRPDPNAPPSSGGAGFRRLPLAGEPARLAPVTPAQRVAVMQMWRRIRKPGGPVGRTG